MIVQPVTSTSLSAVGFDSGTQTLEVEFQNARVYHFHGVPWGVFVDLQAAESKGRFFNARIRNHYPYRQIVATARRGAAKRRSDGDVPAWERCALCGEIRQVRRA